LPVAIPSIGAGKDIQLGGKAISDEAREKR
jgi:hypothetical protein